MYRTAASWACGKMTAANLLSLPRIKTRVANCDTMQLSLRRLHFTAAELPRPMDPASHLKVEKEAEYTQTLLQPEDVRLVRLEHNFKLHLLHEVPQSLVTLSKSEAICYYRQLETIRRLEQAASQLYGERNVRGFCHLYTGQEACAVGMRAAMRPQDNIITAYRAHGWAYLMGISLLGVLAELTGRASGCSLGKGGSMHMYTKNFYGGNGIVGAQVPLGAGIALASKYRGEDSVCLTLYGDGAANQGQVFETFNMALLWKLPIVFVCENNNYGMGTSAARSSSNTNYYTRGDLLPGIWVNGMDVLAVRSATQYAIQHARTYGPLLLELQTYRYSGHSMSDPGTSYRTREEVQHIRDHSDPIGSFRELCEYVALLSPMEMQAIDDQVRLEVDEAARQARNDAELPLQNLCSHIYARYLQPNVRGVKGY